MEDRREEELWLVSQASLDQKAFSVLYERYYDHVYKFFYHKMADKKESEDLTALTFNKVLKELQTFPASGQTFADWLFVVAESVLVNYVKQKNVQSDAVKKKKASSGPAMMEDETVDSGYRAKLLRELGQSHYKSEEDEQRERESVGFMGRHWLFLILFFVAAALVGGWYFWTAQPECPQTCVAGTRSCLDAKTSRSCGDFDNDGCYEWGEEEQCFDDYSCRAGSCVLACENNCEMGMQRCQGEGIEVCGNFDDDPCLDWGQPSACEAGSSCVQGACLPQNPNFADCSNECNGIERRCAGDGYQICGNFDDDVCLEWGIVNGCSEGSACEFGICKRSDDYCRHECELAYDRTCLDETGYRICGNFDGDGCLEWGMLNPCAAGSSCELGVCQ